MVKYLMLTCRKESIFKMPHRLQRLVLYIRLDFNMQVTQSSMLTIGMQIKMFSHILVKRQTLHKKENGQLNWLTKLDKRVIGILLTSEFWTPMTRVTNITIMPKYLLMILNVLNYQLIWRGHNGIEWHVRDRLNQLERR